jgi:hypothetical protein
MKVRNQERLLSPTIRLVWCSIFAIVAIVFALARSERGAITSPGAAGIAFQANLDLTGKWTKTFALSEGQTFEISARLPLPSQLPQHGRVAVSWSLIEEQKASSRPTTMQPGSNRTRKPDAFGIYTQPTANWRKVLHALDPDLYLVYAAPAAGTYTLEISPVANEPTVFEGPRWRETGTVPSLIRFPQTTPWPKATKVPVAVVVTSLDLESRNHPAFHIETEPNDTPEQAQPIALPAGEGVQTALITGGADDIEYFDNGKVGQSGEDWFRLSYQGTEPRLLTCNLTIPDQTLAAQLRFYALDAPPEESLALLLAAGGLSGKLLPLAEYTEGRNENERVHQQNEPHRSEISRIVKPGGVYFLRAEANAPGYEIELRLLKPAPYDDPRVAVRQGLYDHLGQVDAWLTNRPRGASVERRIRDTGNLLGTHCMSCHTQSGVWGAAVPMENGYRPENLQNFRHLVNIMYESLRPTNYLKDAANNTSLPPLDVGDGPAGTRVAGHNVCTAERVVPVRQLYSMQAIRAANQVLQTADPSGVNAAGPGSNVGQAVVYNYAGEILRTAWDRTGHPRYFAALEEKAEKMLAVEPKYMDDLAHRIEFFQRFFPHDYPAESQKAHAAQEKLPPEPPEPEPVKGQSAAEQAKEPPPARFPSYQLKSAREAQELWSSIQQQLHKDEARLRMIQHADGSWGFDPGKSMDNGKSWKTEGPSDPAPTALALIALQALGHGREESSVAKGVNALLKMQDPCGRWNKSAQTGFVTTAYSLHALSRLYPSVANRPNHQEYEPKANESLLETLARGRAMSLTEDAALANLMIQAGSHSSPLVRYWGVMGLGGIHSKTGVPALIRSLGDPVKMVRDAAAWAMKQTLLDDVGFEELFVAFHKGDDVTRESVLKALGMRADTVMTQARLDKSQLSQLLVEALNADPHPGVRAWAARASWQWWIWNPPLREPIQQAWVKKLLSAESNALVENCFRYQSHALFIANGHKANASYEHQYPELASFFKALQARLDDPQLTGVTKDRLAERLVAIAATFYNTSGGDGGPGQMGYVTPGSADAVGKAVLRYFNKAESRADRHELRLALEGAAGVTHTPLQDKLIAYSTSGPEELRTLAAAAVSDPTAVTLPATQELVQPLIEQVFRGAQDEERRETLSEPVLKLFSRAHWAIPKTAEQQAILYSLLIPKYDKNPDTANLAKIKEAAEAAVRPMGLLSADWYVADRAGRMLAANPDLQTDTLLGLFPSNVKNPLEAHFWLRNVNWVMTYGEGLPEIAMTDGLLSKEAAQPSALPEPLLAARSRALQLYLEMLSPRAPSISRSVAVTASNVTALRQLSSVREALEKLSESEKDEEIQKTIRNVLRSNPEAWLADLREAVKAEPLAASLKDASGGPAPNDEFVASFRYFSDYVAPELNRPQRMDEMACMNCHAVPGRVPSMQLEAPDQMGYFSVAKMLKNYLVLQQRVNPTSIEQSKLLRKPLNIQTGKEDGHQGGRRYLPSDRGYQIIRRWVLDQPRVLQRLGNSPKVIAQANRGL